MHFGPPIYSNCSHRIQAELHMHMYRKQGRKCAHRACCALCSGQTTAKSSSTRQRGAFSQGAAELETLRQTGVYLVPATDTCQTRMRLSLYPAKRDWHCGGSALALPGTSGLNSSTMFLLSRSQILMVGPVAAHSQYLLGLNVRALIVSAPC